MKTIFHNPKVKQINYCDNRFYQLAGADKYFPSVTTILAVYPKSFGFYQWMQDVGDNAKRIADRAADIGSKIHDITEKLNEGQEILWANEAGETLYSLDEWKLLLRFADFWKVCTPEIICCEESFCSSALMYGGTLDRVLMIAGVRYLVDIKTSNYLHKTHELQQAAYAMLWNEFNPHLPIEKTGTLWLKANIRTNKIDLEKEIYQGVTDAGAWQLKIFERHYEESFKIFKHAQAIWREENPVYKPANLIFDDRIKLDLKQTT